jgi:hypothetical protein
MPTSWCLLLIASGVLVAGCEACVKGESVATPSFEGICLTSADGVTAEESARYVVGCSHEQSQGARLVAFVHSRGEARPAAHNTDFVVLLRLPTSKVVRQRCAVGPACEVDVGTVSLLTRKGRGRAASDPKEEQCEFSGLFREVHHEGPLRLFPATTGIVELSSNEAGNLLLSFDVTTRDATPGSKLRLGVKRVPLDPVAEAVEICRGCGGPATDAGAADAGPAVLACFPLGRAVPCDRPTTSQGFPWVPRGRDAASTPRRRSRSAARHRHEGGRDRRPRSLL